MLRDGLESSISKGCSHVTNFGFEHVIETHVERLKQVSTVGREAQQFNVLIFGIVY